MKKLVVLATAAFLFTGAFAGDGGKKPVKGKEECSKTCSSKTCCKKTTDKTETKTATKAIKKA